MNTTPWGLDARPLSPRALELETALLTRAPHLAVLSISTGGSTDDGMLVSGDAPRRVRIWGFGTLWMIRPEVRRGAYWYFVTDNGATTTDPRIAERAACDDVDSTARLVVDWLVDPVADWLADRDAGVLPRRP